MKEERMKVLEMIQDGKITAEDAMKLLDALGDTTVEPQREGRQRQRHRRRRSGGADIQVEVRERVREARETLRGAMPNVNRMVREATRSIPDVGKIVQEAMQTASEAWTKYGDRKYPEKAVRQQVDTTPIQVSDRLSVRTSKGHVTSKIWDRDEIKIDAKISVWGVDEEAVNAFAEQIDIQIRRESDAVQIRPNVPKRKKGDPIRSVRIDFELHHPEKVDLDVRANRGNITLPKIDGAANIKQNRGKTILEGASGNISIEQNRSDAAVQHVGGDFTAKNNRGSIKVGRVGRNAVVKNNRGTMYLANIVGTTTAVQTSRGAIEIENPEAGVMIKSRGGNIVVRPHKPIGDDYAIENKDGAVDLTIPDGSAVDVHGYVGRGDIQTNLPLSITGVSRTSQVVTGQLNGGGCRVAIELGRGSLSLYSDEEMDETPTPPEPPDPPESGKK